MDKFRRSIALGLGMLAGEGTMEAQNPNKQPARQERVEVSSPRAGFETLLKKYATVGDKTGLDQLAVVIQKKEQDIRTETGLKDIHTGLKDYYQMMYDVLSTIQKELELYEKYKPEASIQGELNSNATKLWTRYYSLMRLKNALEKPEKFEGERKIDINGTIKEITAGSLAPNEQMILVTFANDVKKYVESERKYFEPKTHLKLLSLTEEPNEIKPIF